MTTDAQRARARRASMPAAEVQREWREAAKLYRARLREQRRDVSEVRALLDAAMSRKGRL